MERNCKYFDTRFTGKPFCGDSVKKIVGPECNKDCSSYEIDPEKSAALQKDIEYKIIFGSNPETCEKKLNKMAQKFKLTILQMQQNQTGYLTILLTREPLE